MNYYDPDSLEPVDVINISTLYVDDVPCTISNIKKSSHGFAEVHVNEFASCHNLPLNWLIRGEEVIKTSGHSYRLERN